MTLQVFYCWVTVTSSYPQGTCWSFMYDLLEYRTVGGGKHITSLPADTLNHSITQRKKTPNLPFPWTKTSTKSMSLSLTILLDTKAKKTSCHYWRSSRQVIISHRQQNCLQFQTCTLTPLNRTMQEKPRLHRFCFLEATKAMINIQY